MNDKLIVSDILETEKNITANLATSLNEASCDNIYNCFSDIFESSSKLSKTFFTIAYNNNWYTLQKAESKNIKSKHSKLSKDLDNLLNKEE